MTLRDDAVLEEVYYAVVVVVIGWVVMVITMMGLFKLKLVVPSQNLSLIHI